MKRAVLFEEHASVLPHWVAQGVRGATLVCLDAHLDLQFIAPERIARLRACGTAADLAQLEGRHPLGPDRSPCYGIEDFLYAAARLGVVRRLVWLAPPHVLADLDAALHALRQMEGVTPEQLASFRRMPGDWIAGELLGLEIAVAEWRHLAAVPLEEPVLLDVDADFFVRVPQEQVWVQPCPVVSALRQWLGDATQMTIARSVGTGFLPLRHRFLADHVAALWEGRSDEARHWDQLLELEQGGLPPAARVPRLRALAQARPDCAAVVHALALACEDGARRRDLLAQAAALDPHYAPDPLRTLGALRARRQDVSLASVLQLQREAVTLEEAPHRQGAAWVALGLLYAAFGRLREAMDCDERSLRFGSGHPDLALHIARLQMAQGDLDAAAAWLQRAAGDDETRVLAWHQLSLCAARRGASAEALRWARSAQAAAPAWPELQHWVGRLERGKT